MHSWKIEREKADCFTKNAHGSDQKIKVKRPKRDQEDKSQIGDRKGEREKSKCSWIGAGTKCTEKKEMNKQDHGSQ